MRERWRGRSQNRTSGRDRTSWRGGHPRLADSLLADGARRRLSEGLAERGSPNARPEAVGSAPARGGPLLSRIGIAVSARRSRRVARTFLYSETSRQNQVSCGRSNRSRWSKRARSSAARRSTSWSVETSADAEVLSPTGDVSSAPMCGWVAQRSSTDGRRASNRVAFGQRSAGRAFSVASGGGRGRVGGRAPLTAAGVVERRGVERMGRECQ